MPKRLLFTLTLLLCASMASALVVYHLVDTTTTTLITFSSLANNTRLAASGTIFDNRQGQTFKGYTRAKIECALTYAAAPNANSSLDVWFLESIDGTNFTDATTNKLPNLSCATTTSGATTRVIYEVPIPSERFKVTAQNSASGQTLSSGTLKLIPITTEVK